jgi:cellulose synthase operon protein C
MEAMDKQRTCFGRFLALLFLVGILGGLSAWAYQTGQKKEEDKGKDKNHRPTLQYQNFRPTRAVEVKMAEKRQGIRQQLEELLKYEKEPKECAALKFRLAENYFEEAIAFFNQAQQLDDKLIKDQENEKLRKEVDEDKKKLKEQEDIWKGRAIKIYQEVVRDYPDAPNRDEVMFYLAQSMWDLQRYKEALAVYKELIATYEKKKSKYIPDSYLAFGEYYFDQSNKDPDMLEKSLMAYKKVAEFEESDIYPYALYKQGWVYFNLRECEKAKDMFQTVIYLEDMDTGTHRKRFEIRKEALKDFTLTYSQEGCGSAKEAPRVFEKLAPKESHDMLISLAAIYFGTGQDKQAFLLYSHLIKLEKCSAEHPFYQGRMVDSASRLGNDSAARRFTVKQVRELVEQFKKTQECVKNPNPKQKDRIRESRELAELTLRSLCNRWYKEAKETKQRETFEHANEMCGDYLEVFPESPDAYDIRFAYAEMLNFRLGQYERAAFEYGKIVAADLSYLKEKKAFPKERKDKDGRSTPGTYMCDAAYKAVQAYQQLMKSELKKDKEGTRQPKDHKSVAYEDIKKLPIPKGRKRFIQASEIYMDHCPTENPEDLCDLKYEIAMTYYSNNYFDESFKRFDEIVRGFPANKLAGYAANLVLDILNLKKDFETLDVTARKYFQSNALMKDEELRKTLKDLIPKIAFKRVNEMEEKLKKPVAGKKPLPENKIHHKVAMAYVNFVKEFKDHELADDALFNAGVEFDKAERLDLARKARQMMIDDYQNSDLVPGTIFSLAENYERMADFNQAANLYETYASRYKKMAGLGKALSIKGKKEKKEKGKKDDKEEKKKAAEKKIEGNRRTWNDEDAQAALVNAGIYREALRQYEKSIKDREDFIDQFPESSDTPKVHYSLGLLFEKMKNYPKAIDKYGSYSVKYIQKNPDKAIAATMKRAMLYLKLEKWKEYDKEVRSTLAAYRKAAAANKTKKLLEASEAAAHAEFILSEPVFKEYTSFKFTSPDPKKLLQQVGEKTNRFKKVEKVYTDIAALKQAEWAIASLYMLGRAYENFSETFCNAPVPPGLNAEQKEMYKSEICQNKGQPFIEKAVAHFEAAVAKGSEYGFYSHYTQKSLEKLQQYRPDKYPIEDLGFELAVVADVPARSPMLVATWAEVEKNPDLLNEPVVRQERPATEPAPKSPDKKQVLKPGETKEPGKKPPEEPEKKVPETSVDQGKAPGEQPAATEEKPEEEASPGNAPESEPAPPPKKGSSDEEPKDDF